MAIIGDIVETSSAFLGLDQRGQGQRVNRSNYKCTGVFHCEYLDPAIKDLHHTDVDNNVLQLISERRVRNREVDGTAQTNALVTCFANIQ
jgi:hypothetical protein